MTGTHELELLAVIAGACGVATLARAKGLAPPVLLVLAGLVVSAIPGMPVFRLNPQFVLVAVLPPLVYTSALESSYLSLRDNVRTLTLLSVGLVLFTAFAVAGAAHVGSPGLPLTAAFTLGAILAPTDAVTTVSVGRRLRLPRRLLVVITGESMLNDGTALTLYTVAVAAAAGLTTPSPLHTAWEFVAISVAGVAVGLGLGVVVHFARMRLRDPITESALSLLVPFAAFLLAEAVGGSGMLAVVVAGLYLGHHSGRAHFASRLQTMAVWRVASFVLEAVTFALIGLQLRPIVEGLAGTDPGRLAMQAGLVTFAVVLGTLLAQGLPLPVLIRWLGVHAGRDEARADLLAQSAAKQRASAAGLGRLEELASQRATHAPAGVVDELRRLALDTQSGTGEAVPGDDGEESPSAAFRRLRREMTSAERAALIRQRDERAIDDEVLRTLLRGLDLEEAMLASEEWDAGGPP